MSNYPLKRHLIRNIFHLFRMNRPRFITITNGVALLWKSSGCFDLKIKSPNFPPPKFHLWGNKHMRKQCQSTADSTKTNWINNITLHPEVHLNNTDLRFEMLTINWVPLIIRRTFNVINIENNISYIWTNHT